MTNSFFQTRVHPDDVHLTTVTTLLGLYEWLAMPMGLRNSPAIHQRRMTAALREHLGKICHIYLDDIIIWSNTVAEHARHIELIMASLRKARLHCNPHKCNFFQREVDFLGHHISERGIEPNSSKVEKILNWPVPKSSTDVRAFLGLVRYISVFLPKLADHTCILTPLTTKDCRKKFPNWTTDHQTAFDTVKALVVSADCLTVIDHEHPGENNIFVTCDTSDWRMGATLSFGPTWETAHPVAFDSMQLKAAEKNYPVHEKELLAVIRALKKWCSDLLGTHFYVYTDHRTLENFDTQKDLSRRQLRWQEFLSQYDLTMTYIHGEDNTIADALSWLPPNCFADESPMTTATVNAVLKITSDNNILKMIRDGYEEDEFCKRVASSNMKGWTLSNGLWYIGDRLLIPRVTSLHETLFHLAHDTLGHFGADKSYASLCDAYYWPNMRRDLEQAYIPACADCL
jgi:RNase H-like domain found in reverse transcriptase/Reverse transcriptase (RNA-dependent DNA polymerase)/Integrase zinc binding domain